MQRGAGLLVPAGLVLLLAGFVVAAALLTQQWTRAEAIKAVPSGGFYWPVAQYQLAHAHLKEALLIAASGNRSTDDVLSRHWAIAASRASVLTEPSQVRTLLESVPGYVDATRRIADLHGRVGPVLDQPYLTQAEALQVLEEFKAASDELLLAELGNTTRQAELGAQEALLNTLSNRLGWIWAGLGLSWTVLGLWLVSAVQSRRRLTTALAGRLQAIQAMEDAIGIKRKFVSMVSHELRSPLQSIVTAAESLSQDTDMANTRPQSIAAIRRIQRAVGGLQAQLRDLLTTARSDSGQLCLQLETFDPSELVSDVCADFEDAARDKGLMLHIVLPDKTDHVHADPVRVAQVLRNLLENAIRYTASGTVSVELHALVAGAAASGAAMMRLTVADTGPGIPPDILARMKSTAPWVLLPENSGHSGGQNSMRLGLLVIRDVIHQLGGEVDVTGRAEEGTTARVSIPVTLPGDTDTPPLPESDAADEQLHVLVVDDHQEMLDALQDAVLRLGHRCDTALSAMAAEPLLAQCRFDTVLVDLVMPDKSGLLLAQEIRGGTGPNRDSMLILISSPDNRNLGLQPPFDGFLGKPIDTWSLHRLIGSRTPQ